MRTVANIAGVVLLNRRIKGVFLSLNTVVKKIGIALAIIFAIGLSNIYGQNSNVTISTAADANINFAGNTYTPTGDNANINIINLLPRLIGGNVTVVTARAGGGQAGNVIFANPITSANTSTTQYTFTVNAAGTITVNAASAINLTASNLVGSNNTARPGINVTFNAGSSISIASAITTSGNRRGTNNGGNGGNIIMTAPGGITITANFTADGANGSAGFNGGNGGNITINDGAAGVTTGGGVNDGQTSGVIASAGGTGVVNGSGGTFTKTGTGTLVLQGVNTFTGGTTLTAGQLNINNSQALGAATGTFTISNGTIDNTTGAALTTLNYPLAWNGDFTFTGSNNLNLGTGTVTISANRQVTVSANTLTVAGIINTPALNLTKAGSGTFAMGANAVSLNNLTINAGSLTATSGNLNIAGNFVNTGTFNHNNGTVNFNGAGAQAIAGESYYNLSVSTSGIKTLAGNVSVASNLAINNTAVLASDIYQITGGTGTFSMAAGTGLTLGRSGNATVVTMPVFATATNLNANSTVTYQTLGGSQNVAGVTYGNLTIDGGGIKVLQGPATVNRVLTLTSGVLQLGVNDLTIANASNTAISGTPSATSMIETNSTGSLVKQGATVTDFVMVYPVGTGSSYTPMHLNGLTSGGITNPGSVKVNTVASIAPGIPGVNPLVRYWVTSTNNIAAPIVADVQFDYVNGDIDPAVTAFDYDVYYNPGTWSVPSGASPTGSLPSGSTNFYANTSSTLTATWSASKSNNKVFYTLISGDWDNASTWTLDPSGSLPNNPGNLTPSTSPTRLYDEVVILPGKTVTIQPGNDNKLNAKLTVNGVLDFTTTTGHSFTTINGSGRIILKADNFPSGNATHFITKDQGEGTVVFQGTSGYTLTVPHTFYHVEVSLTNPTDVLTLFTNYLINGNLSIISGVLQINNNASATALSEIVRGTTTIYPGAKFTVGTGNAIHSIEFHGDVLNNGTIDFANDLQYACAATGAVKAYFTGASDNTLTCNGLTDFYRMFINKGIDDTYILSVLSSNITNFRLFGPIDGAACIEPSDGPGGWERLALVLVNGTLKLGSNINIPRLGSNRTGNQPNEFHIPSNSRLWINGANVATYDAGGGWRGITIYGTLQVSSGSFTNPDNTGGITYFANVGFPGKLVLEGGDIYTTQVKQADANGRFSYFQTGGTLHINNLSDSRGSSAVFALPTSDFVFNMSGGNIIIDAVNTTATNGIQILCDPANVSVTGGTIQLNVPTLDAAGQPQFLINSMAPFYNLTLNNSGRGGSQPVVLQNPLTIKNDLIIGSNTTLTTNNYNLTVGGNMSVAGTYTPGTNTTTFDGSGSKSFTNNGTINPSLNNWIINKPGGSLTLGGSGTFICTNLLTLTGGTLDDGGKTITINKNIANSAVHSSTGAGKIVLSGGSAQHIVSGNGSGKFGNIELNDINGASFSTDQQINGTLIMTSGILDIGINKLNLVGAISPNDITSYSAATRMIRMAGNDSDVGIVRTVTANGTVYFPIGTNANAVNRYTPAVATLSAVNGTGTLQINVADKELATLAQPVGNALTYYWRVRYDGFTGTPTVIYQFTGVDSDDYNGLTPAGYNASVVPGKVLVNSPYTRSNESTTDITGFVITFNGAGAGFALEDANYTAGLPAKFAGAPTVFYTNGNYQVWNNGATWHQGSKAGPTGTVPTTGSIVHIYSDGTGNARITVDGTGIPNAPAEINFDQDYVPSQAPTTENISRLQFYNGPITANLGNVKGTGMISFGQTGITVNGDFGDFGTNPNSYYLFFDNGGAPNPITTIPSPIPNLMIEYSTRINKNITVNNDFIIQGSSTVIPLQNITINRDLVLGYWQGGTFQFPAAPASALTISVGRNIDYTEIFNPTGTRNITVENAVSAFEHRLIINGNIIHGSRNTDVFSLYNTGQPTRTRVILELAGAGTNTYSRTSTSIPNLYRLVINKGSDQTGSFTFPQQFTINGTTNSSPKALELQNGTLNLNNSSFSFALTTGGANFIIPSTSLLNLQSGTYTASGGSGISLNGTLQISGGTLNMAGGDNMIEYSASGSANLIVSSGSLTVGSQIRRSPLLIDGVLRYNQSGGTVIVGASAAPTSNRGVFEILNSGSDFTFTGGNLTIRRAQTGTPTIASLYLDPSTSNIASGSVINIGDASTPAGQEVGIYSSIPLQTLTVNSTNSPVAKMWIEPLTLNGNLNINPTAGFDANGLNLILKGNMTNSGTFTPNGNDTYFNGSSAQTISGNTTFYNLFKTTSNDLNLAPGTTTLTISNNLSIQAGSITDNSNNIYVKGSCNLDGTHVYGGSGNGITLNGSIVQQLTGNGQFGKLTTDNIYGIIVPLGNNFTIQNALRLTNGVFSIGKNLLTLNLNAVIEAGSPFSAVNMIQTNISFTDYGVKKIFPSGASSFTFPIGCGGKYTPVILNITANGNSSGSITVKAADEMHPSIVEDSESPSTEIVDKENVLQYYWVLRSNGINGFSSTVDMQYDPADVRVLPPSPYTINDYITARLKNDGTGDWDKYVDNTTVDKVLHLLKYTFAGVNDNNISGDYTAGVDFTPPNKGAIPDNVPVYETNASGNYTDDIWTPSISGGPRGSITRINSGHIVTSLSNYILNYTTEINGTIKLNSTFGHRFGEVKGTGTIYTETNALPAGAYEQFFSSAGGTLEYGGNTGYDILGNISTVNNLTLSGTGDRNFPNTNVTLNGNLTINGGNVVAYDGRQIDINGNLSRTGGSFNAGIGSTSVLFSAAVNQNITGDFTGSNSLNILNLNNPNGLTLAGNVEVKNQITLTNGAITTGSNTLTLGLTGTITPNPGTLSSYINGALTKILTAGQSFEFPIGKNANLGPISVSGIAGFAGTGNWTSEYFTGTFAGRDPASFEPALQYVSHFEYWSVQAPASGTGNLIITLDGSSDVANSVSVLSDIRIVGWSSTNSRWEIIGGVPSVSGTNTSGTVTSGSPISFDSWRYITLASATAIVTGTATITSGDASLCAGGSSNIVVFFTGASPWVLNYKVNGVAATPINTSTNPYTINTGALAVTTTYLLTSMTANGVAGSVVGDIDAVITVNANPTVSLSANPGTTICAGTSVTFTATTGLSNYQFFVGAIPQQNGSSNIYTTSTLANGNVVTVIATNATGCSTTSAGLTITVNPLPTAPILTGAGRCGTGTVSLSASGAGGGESYNWYSTFTGGSIQGTGTPYTTPSISATKTFYATKYNTTSLCESSPRTSVIATVATAPVSGTLTPAPATGAICAGTNISATATIGSGGAGTITDILEYRYDGGGWTTYTSGASLSTTGHTSVDIRTYRTATGTGCTTSTPSVASWTIDPLPTPVITGALSVCNGTTGSVYDVPSIAGHTYNWTVGGGIITAGNGTSSITVTWNILGTGTVDVTETITATSCSADATQLLVTVNDIPTPTLVADVNPVCAGSSVTFTAGPGAGPAISNYDFRVNGVSVQSTASNTFITSSLVNNDIVTVLTTTAASCSATSTGITMTVNPILTASVSIAAAPAGAICAGTSVIFTATPTNGGAAPTYQWYKGAAPIAGETGVTYTSTTLANGDVITVQMTSNATPCLAGSPATSGAITMTVNPILTASVSIAAAPAGAICAGTSVIFTATPTNGGAAPTYQWYKGAAPIAGETGVTYTSTTLANGDVITVQMTSNATPCLAGSPATSGAITMTVNPILTASVSIAAAPAGAICAGTSVIFTATPTNGGAAPTYQWYKGAAPIAGETGVTYTSTTLANGDVITVQMTSNATPCLAGSPATSGAITMTVNPILTASVSIAAAPAGAICAGTSVIFTATPTNGGAAPTYQWYKGAAPIAGETGVTYTSTTLANGDVITVQMTSNATPCLAGSPATSGAITMTVNPILTASVSIAAAPAGAICAGTSVIFTATPTNGGAAPTYQWYKGAAPIAGETGVTYTSTTLANGDVITVQMTSNATPCLAGSPATSGAITMTVNPILTASVSIAAAPAGAICAGTSVIFTATPTNGGAAPTYQWYKGAAPIAGETGVTYTSTTLANGDVITVQMTSNATPCLAGSPATSGAITMTVNPILTASVSIAAAPAGAICAGTSVIFTATPTNGGAAPTYQWYKGAAPIAGETGVTYTSTTLANGDVITVQMTSNATPCLAGSPATSGAITMTVNPILTASVSIAAAPAGAICAGTSVIFTATPTNGGAAPTYQWYKGAAPIAGETGVTYTSTTLANGDVITVQMTSNATPCLAGSPATSGAITMTVNPVPSAPVVGVITQPTCILATGSVVLSGLPAGNWTINPGAITGNTLSTTISGLASGTYNYTVKNSSGCTSLATSNVVINAQPVAPSVPVVGTITQPTCALATGSVILSGLPAGNWTINPGAIAGNTLSTTISGLASGTYNFTVTTSSGCTSLATSNVVINAQPVTPIAPIIGTITQPTCGSPTGSVILSGLPAGNWTINPGSITGNTFIRTITGLAAGTYNYTITNSAGCTSLPSANVVINTAPATPSAPVIGTITQPTCTLASGSVALSGLPATGTWTVTASPGGSTITGTGSTGIFSGLVANTYTFTVTDGTTTCISLPSANAIINAQPATPAVPIVGTITQPTCGSATGSVVLSGLPAGNWTINPGAIAGNTLVTTVTGLATGTYNFTVTNSSGCTSVSSANVVINAAPAGPSAPVIGPITQPTCALATGSVVLNGLPAAGTWTVAASPGGSTITGTGTTGIFSGLVANTYTFTVTDGTSTCTSVASSNAVINAQPATPVAPVVGTITQPSCASATGSVVLTGLPAGNWTIMPGAIAGTTVSTTVSGLVAGTYRFTVTNSSGCTSPASINVVINTQPSVPTVSITSQSNALCQGSSTGSVTVAGAGGTPPYLYKIGQGSYQNSGTFGVLAAGSYLVTVQDGNLCTAVVTVIITEPGVLLITHTKQDVSCQNIPEGAITLTITGGTQPYSVIWSDGALTVNRQNIFAGTYKVIATDLNGCTASDEVIIDALGSQNCIQVQEIITPNNDGYYDTWKIKNIEMFPNAEVEVFNRWGKRVFNTKNIPANEWNGTFEGKLLPTDSYHYILYLNDGSKPISGIVTIVR